MKPYKAEAPEATVERIRNILERHGIEVEEKRREDASGLFFSVRLRLSSGKLPAMDIGTNGKGRSMAYALASAYGELMERLQSLVVFGLRDCIPKKLSGLKYSYAPDEKVLAGNEFREALRRYVSVQEDKALACYSEQKEVGVPFLRVNDGEKIFLPMRIITHSCGSNGMCAGNTPQEAILQGLCEIFERYALRLIYHRALTPPRIDKSVPVGEALIEKIKILEHRENCSIEIMDCSCGIGLPVYGLRIISNDGSAYQFHLGSDMVAEVAVERIVTELLQNREHIEMRKFDIKLQQRLCSDLKLIETERVKYSFKDNYVPLSIFGSEPSYEAAVYDKRRGISDEQDLAIAIRLIYDLGKEMYVRDNSFLGFPAYTIYVPGMSELINVESTRWLETSFEKSAEIAVISHRLTSAVQKDVDVLLDNLLRFNGPAFLEWFVGGDVWATGEPRFVIGIIAASQRRWEAAMRMLEPLVQDCRHDKLRRIYSFYYDYCSIAVAGNNPMDYLTVIYGKDDAVSLEKILSENRWREVFNFTNCFDCARCAYRKDCAMEDYVELLCKLEKIYAKNIPDLENLSTILDDRYRNVVRKGGDEWIKDA